MRSGESIPPLTLLADYQPESSKPVSRRVKPLAIPEGDPRSIDDLVALGNFFEFLYQLQHLPSRRIASVGRQQRANRRPGEVCVDSESGTPERI